MTEKRPGPREGVCLREVSVKRELTVFGIRIFILGRVEEHLQCVVPFH